MSFYLLIFVDLSITFTIKYLFDGTILIRRIKLLELDDYEYVLPLGRFSFSLMLRASKTM